MSQVARPDQIVLAVPGGLAGQLFAVAYAAWIRVNLGWSVHIQFHDIGISGSELSVAELLDTPKARELELTFAGTGEVWPPQGNGFDDMSTLPALSAAIRMCAGNVRRLARLERRSTIARLQATRWLSRLGSRPEIIRKDSLYAAPPGSLVVGYPVDYQIVEEVWPLVLQMVRESSRAAVANDVGRLESIAVHWRLGDYLGHPTHGTVSWSGIRDTICAHYPKNMFVEIFTDSPDLAQRVIGDSMGKQPYVIRSTDIWTDLGDMTACRAFVGTNSGVSIVAALTLLHGNAKAEVWLPNRWFINKQHEATFSRPQQLFRRSHFYAANLVTSRFPI